MLLVVDDDLTFLEQSKVLDMGRGVFLAESAEDAKKLLSFIGTDPISTVIVDLDLPGQDGFSFIRDIHQDYPELPVIAISGVFQKHVLESAKVVGAAETLRKPITNRWRDVIRRLRERRLAARLHLGSVESHSRDGEN